MLHLGIIGFGEAGYHITKGLIPETASVAAYDSLFGEAGEKADKLREHAAENKVALVKNLNELVERSEIILCLTSAGSALSIAKAIAPMMRKGQIYSDLNSTSPATKEAINEIFSSQQASFIESAVMNSVPANGTRVPINACGVGCREYANLLNGIGMNVNPMGEQIGRASAMKMLRSVLAKGMIALITETVFSTDKYGITEPVLEEFGKVITEEMSFHGFCNYAVASAAVHNERFCHEMEEVLQTMDAIGEDSIMTQATLKKFQWLCDQGYSNHFVQRPSGYPEVLRIKKEMV